MARLEMELRNLPRHRILEYLQEVGGQPQPDNELRMEGEGWAAWLEAMPPAIISVMEIRRDLLVIEGDDARIEPIYQHMRMRTMRGGG